MEFQTRGTSGTTAAGVDVELVAPLDMGSYQVQQSPSLINSATQLDSAGDSQFDGFSFPYQGLPDGMSKQELDSYTHRHTSQLGHRGSVSSMHGGPRGSFSSGVPAGHARNASLSGGSDAASPASNRGSGSYGDEFSFNNAVPGDGSDLGARTRGDTNDSTGAAPPWSELKTKAGKERKRLPLACIACRRKKIRCSGEKPACKHCLRSRIPCVYKVTTRKAAPRTDYMAMLDKRLKRMEDRIIKIVPKEEQDATVTVTRATVKPALPGSAAARSSAGKKRDADEAFGPELDSWAQSTSNPNLEGTSKPSTLMAQEAEESKLLSEGNGALPSKEIQEHLAEIFFENVYGQTYHLLHKPSFMRKLK
jgi:hypothetical protein